MQWITRIDWIGWKTALIKWTEAVRYKLSKLNKCSIDWINWISSIEAEEMEEIQEVQSRYYINWSNSIPV